MFKKATALVLIFAMLLGIGPAVYAAQKDEPAPADYKFEDNTTKTVLILYETF